MIYRNRSGHPKSTARGCRLPSISSAVPAGLGQDFVAALSRYLINPATSYPRDKDIFLPRQVSSKSSDSITPEMKTTTVLATALALLGVALDSVSAAAIKRDSAELFKRNLQCYGSISLNNDEYINVRDTIDLLCVFSDLHDTFAPSQTKTDCLRYDRGSSGSVFARVIVQNQNDHESKRLAADECKQGLHAVFNNCPARAGGQDAISGWRYEVNVNNQQCA